MLQNIKVKKRRTYAIEIRKTCKVCGVKITKPRFRTFCSTECRNRETGKRWQSYRTIWARERRDNEALKPSSKKVKCLVCGRYYVQVGSHIYQVHKMTAREYREGYELPVKRGIVPRWYREIKAEQAIECGGADNLKKGKKYRFKKGDARAIKNTFYKGRAVEASKLPQEIYPR